MKKIQKVVFPLNLGTATILSVYCLNDNLNNSAIFAYSLLSEEKGQLQQGNLTMSGVDYNNWSTNDYAYEWVAKQINVVIIEDYVPTVSE